MARLGAIVAAPSLRRLAAGAGTVTQVGRVLTFSSPQSFKRGATVRNATAHWTIEEGAGTTWMTQQLAGCGHGNISGTFHMSDQGTGRARGGVAGSTAAPIVPYAYYCLYVSALDDTGQPDPYTYADSLHPEGTNGMLYHPYTRDKFIGAYLAQARLHCNNPAHTGNLEWDTVPGPCSRILPDSSICQGSMVNLNICALAQFADKFPGAPGGVSGYIPQGFDDPGKLATIADA